MNSIIKKIVNADIKALIEAGYLDETLNLTSIGRGRLNSVLFSKPEIKKELVEMAKEDIKEAKENVKDC